MLARNIMHTSFPSLQPDTPIGEAIGHFRQASDLSGRRVFGMMVVDEKGGLAGILSMYDILTLLQPKHVHIWGEMSDIDMSGLVETMCRKSREIIVGDIMSTDIVTVNSETHLFAVLELMNKYHIRRIPVVEADRVVGIIYISDLFFTLVDRIQAQEG